MLDSESDSDSSLDFEETADPETEIAGQEEEDGGDQEDIPLSEIESLASEDKADILPHQRLTINNTSALQKAHKSISLPYSTLPFSAHQSITTAEPVAIADVNDDLTRELAFYKQCLDAANDGRTLLKKEGVPFSRPNDYFAEMVKSDEHMGKIKQKMVDEAANKKAAADARKQRDLKKFGKQVQVAKLQERDKAKRDTLDKINLLKRSMFAAPGMVDTGMSIADTFDSQNGRTPMRARRMKKIFSISRSTTLQRKSSLRGRQGTSQTEAHRGTKSRRKMKSSDLAERRGSRRARTLLRLLI